MPEIIRIWAKRRYFLVAAFLSLDADSIVFNDNPLLKAPYRGLPYAAVGLISQESDGYRAIVGYSEDYEGDISEVLRVSFCPIAPYWQKDGKSLKQYLYAYKCSTTDGMSGAPIFFRENDKYKIIGIHRSEYNLGNFNGGVYINLEKFERIKYWIAHRTADPDRDKEIGFF